MAKTVLIVAKRQETRSTRFSRSRDLDYRASVLFRNGGLLQSDHRWSLYGVECISQHRSDELSGDKLDSDFVPFAADADDLLLFSHRPHPTHQGRPNNKTVSSSWLFSDLFAWY